MVVLGHSFGGGVATKFAHDHADKARYLVVVNSVGDPSAFVGNLLSRMVDVDGQARARSDDPAHAAELDRSDGPADPAHVRRQRHARPGGDGRRRSCRDGGRPRRRDGGAGGPGAADAGAVERRRRRHPDVGVRHVLFDVRLRRAGGGRRAFVAPGPSRRVRSGARQHRADPGDAALRTGRHGQHVDGCGRCCARRPCRRP